MHDTTMPRRALTAFAGRAGDRNDRAMIGSLLVAEELGRRLGVEATVIGEPEPVLNLGWEPELAAALPVLRAMAAHYDGVYAAGRTPVTALTRCAVALATVPVVARHRPDAVVLWFDAHADLNTPETTPSGYLGGLALSGPLGLWDSGLGAGLDPSAAVLVGTRDIDPAEQALLDDGTVRLVRVGDAMPEALHSAIGGRPVYVHLDCDVLEPGTVPTEYSSPHGLSLDDLHHLAEVIAATEVVGVEIAEFEGVWADGGAPASPTALLDALEPLVDAAGR